MRIHLISNIDNGKGLERDFRLLRAVLEGWGHTVEGVHFQRHGAVQACDLAVFLEVYEPRLAERAARRWLIPNPEWWRPEEAHRLADFELVLCKTWHALRLFSELTPNARYLGFCAEDRLEPGLDRKRHFLHVAGGSPVKGTDTVLETWRRYHLPYPLTIVSSQSWPRSAASIQLVGRIDERRLRALQNTSSFHLCPSRYEGYGHTIREGLSVGACVVVPDTEAMNEIAGCAVRVPALPSEQQGLVSLTSITPADLRDAVERCAGFPDGELERVARSARQAFTGERERFLSKLWQLLDSRASVAVPRNVAARAERVAHGPRLAIVFPCHVSGLELVRRSVLALRSQSAPPDCFEVVVACDGGDPDGAIRKALAPETHPFKVTLVSSTRPGGNVPHRNHARNAGWRAAEAALVWFLDGDFLLPPEAVEHVLAEHDAALARGLPAVFTPVLAGIALPPAAWLDRTAAWVESGDPDAYAALLAASPITGGVYSGYELHFRPGSSGSETLPDLAEGMPIVWRGLVAALSGFDEWFVGWGGEKEAFVDLLKGIQRAGLIDVRLLTSVRALHQPHELDPHARQPEVHQRQAERERRARDILAGAGWWREKLDIVQRALGAAVNAAKAPAQLGVSDRDLDCSAPALAQRERLLDAILAVGAPHLRGLYGGVVVLGEHAELLVERVIATCGLAARALQPEELAGARSDLACGALLANVLAGRSEPELERILRQLDRVVKATAPVIVLECMSDSGALAPELLVRHFTLAREESLSESLALHVYVGRSRSAARGLTSQ
jgi:hypothetical protein